MRASFLCRWVVGDVPAFLNYPRMEVNEAELPLEQLGFFVFSLVFLFDGHTVFASIPYFYCIFVRESFCQVARPYSNGSLNT